MGLRLTALSTVSHKTSWRHGHWRVRQQCSATHNNKLLNNTWRYEINSQESVLWRVLTANGSFCVNGIQMEEQALETFAKWEHKWREERKTEASILACIRYKDSLPFSMSMFVYLFSINQWVNQPECSHLHIDNLLLSNGFLNTDLVCPKLFVSSAHAAPDSLNICPAIQLRHELIKNSNLPLYRKSFRLCQTFAVRKKLVARLFFFSTAYISLKIKLP